MLPLLPLPLVLVARMSHPSGMMIKKKGKKGTLNDAALDELVLGRGFQRDQIHATLPAEIPGRQPVHLLAGGPGIVPREEIALPVESLMDDSCN